jgi:flagellar biosynthesis/type III secretory pathway protein FliH
MINGLIEAKKTDLLWTGYALAAKVFDKNDLPWLKRRFAKMSDFLSDSPVYQELVTEATAKGKAEGKAEGIETGKMQAVSAMQQNLGKKLLSEIDQRFPDLNTLARKRVKGINDADVLLDLLLKVAGASTKQEAQEALTGSMKE